MEIWIYKYESQINYQPASHNVHVVHCNSCYSFLFLNDTCIQKYYRRYSLSYSGVKGFEFDGNAFVLKWTWPKYETQLRRRMKKKGEVCTWAKWSTQLELILISSPGVSITRREYHYPPGWDASPLQDYPPVFAQISQEIYWYPLYFLKKGCAHSLW